MTQMSNDERIIEAATAALAGIVAAFHQHERPTNGGLVAFTVGRDAARGAASAASIHRCWYVWRDGAPGERLDEAAFHERSRDAATGALAAPTWTFHLAPLDAEEWYFEHWFAAPLRMWIGEEAGDRVKEQGASFRARKTQYGWEVEIEDVLAF